MTMRSLYSLQQHHTPETGERERERERERVVRGEKVISPVCRARRSPPRVRRTRSFMSAQGADGGEEPRRERQERRNPGSSAGNSVDSLPPDSASPHRGAEIMCLSSHGAHSPCSVVLCCHLVGRVRREKKE